MTSETLSDTRLEFVPQKIVADPRFKASYEALKNGEYEDRFSGGIGKAFRLILQEKEIITFAALQWLAVGVAYYIWIQVLGWIPMDVWRSEHGLYDFALNIFLLVWSLLCIGLAALPLGLLTGAMGAAQFLRSQNKPSTIAACLTLSAKAIWPLWIYHWIDGWITVDRIFRRLPKRGWGADLLWLSVTAPLYFAWKTAGMAMMPAMLTGKSLLESGEQSIDYVANNLREAIVLRSEYSILCWIFGIASYVGGFMFLLHADAWDSEHALFSFYAFAGIPMLVGVGIIQLFIRPLFVIAACDNYLRYQRSKGEKPEIPDLPGRGLSAVAAFAVLCLALLVVFLYRDELGVTAILELR